MELIWYGICLFPNLEFVVQLIWNKEFGIFGPVNLEYEIWNMHLVYLEIGLCIRLVCLFGYVLLVFWLPQ